MKNRKGMTEEDNENIDHLLNTVKAMYKRFPLTADALFDVCQGFIEKCNKIDNIKSVIKLAEEWDKLQMGPNIPMAALKDVRRIVNE